eukprot:2344054-Alexandrium_andersonii.AAC.1
MTASSGDEERVRNLMALPEVQCGVGHVRRFGVAAPVPACTGVGPVRTGAGRLSVQKPTRW